MHRAECHQESFYYYYFVCLFVYNNSVWFYPRSLGFLLSCSQLGFHLVEWTIIQIRHSLVLPQSLCHHCPAIFHRQCRFTVEEFVAKLVLPFLFWLYAEYPPILRHQYIGREVLYSNPFSLLIFNESCGCCLQECSLAVFVERNLLSW